MRISPEPLTPLKTWRGIWHSEQIPLDGNWRDRKVSHTAFSKPRKRSAFDWLSHLFSRNPER